MPTEITLDHLPFGLSINAARDGESVQVLTAGFVSSEDGQELIRFLEQLPTTLINRARGIDFPVSQVDHLLAVIRKDWTATVYLNELSISLRTLIGADKQAGETVFRDDVIDIDTCDFGVEIPADAGYMFVFSTGWRKGCCFDFGPLPVAGSPRSYDVAVRMGQSFARLMFQERFRIADAEWDRLIAARWFPFVGLAGDTLADLLSHVRHGWDLGPCENRIIEEVRRKASAFLNSWKRCPVLTPHFPILERAVERFLVSDDISCTGLLYPRIEGLMHAHHANVSQERATQRELSRSAVSANAVREWSLFLPMKFERYLNEVYFANFNPADASIGVSRNSVGHGVAHAEGFNAKSSAIGLLVVHQLIHGFGRP